MSVHGDKIAQLTTEFEGAAAGGGDAAGLRAKLEALRETVATAGDATQADVMALDDLGLRLEVLDTKHARRKEHK
jgi:hypothetical protein